MILLNNIKRILIGFIIALASFNASVFAYEIEEETDYVWLQEEIENVSTNAQKNQIFYQEVQLLLIEIQKQYYMAKIMTKKFQWQAQQK